jgi:exonuclease III
MNMENILIWNVRGLNTRAKRDMVHGVVAQEHVSLLLLQETKIDVWDNALVASLYGAGFHFFELPAINTCGGILMAWHRDI